MEETLKKYRVVRSEYEADFETKINMLADVGYRVHTFTNDPSEWLALMSLHSNKFDGITRLVDITPTDVDHYLEQGWEILDTYSKTIRMVKRSKP